MKLLKSRRFWGLLLTVGLLVYCFYDFDFQGVWTAISAIHFWYLIPLIFLEAIIAYIRTARLKYIIDPVKQIRVNDLYPYYCIGMMTNLLMPYLTGQVARVYLLSKKGQLKKTFLFTTTVLEVVFDGMALLGIMVIISLFFVLPEEFKAWHFIVAAGMILAAAVFLFVISHIGGRTVLDKLGMKLPMRARKKYVDIKSSFFSGLETLKSSRHFTVVTLLSVLSWLVQAGMVYILALAFNFNDNISVWGAVIITTVVTIMMLVVLSPVNIGTFQAATVAALRPFGIVKAPALAFSFLLHIAVYLPPVILGAFFSFKEGLTLKQLRVEGEKGVQDKDVEIEQARRVTEPGT